MAEQTSLKIVAEKFIAREKKLVKHLEAYKTLDGDIAMFKSKSEGHGLEHEPSVTAGPPARDYLPYLKYPPESKLDESEDEMAATIERYVHPDTFSYASSYQVVNAIKNLHPFEQAHMQILARAYALLNKPEDDGPKLNDTERTAESRLIERAYYQRKFETLINRKETIAIGMEQMEKFYPEWHRLLWDRYVIGMKYRVIVRRYQTEEYFRTERKNVLLQFDKWTPGLFD